VRHVFPTSEVPHLWAHQTQEDARNPGGNLFFQGATIYSYRTSWPLARIYRRKMKGTLFPKDNPACNLVLTNSERYSVTTAKHQSDVNWAARHLPCVAVPLPDLSGEPFYANAEQHSRNMAYFAEQIAEHLAKAKRAMQETSVTWRHDAAIGLHSDMVKYSAFFGIRRKIQEVDSAAWSAARERAQRIETPDPVRDAAKIRARERKAVREREQMQARYDTYCAAVLEWNAAVQTERAKLPAFDAVAHWRITGKWEPHRVDMGERVAPCIAADMGWRDAQRIKRKMRSLFDMPLMEQVYDSSRPDNVFLRVSGDQIESSMGARIPLDHAPRIWALVQACRSSGRAYQANGHTEHAGPYAIDSVSAQGELKAGCHTIPYAELELMARTLGLAA
jgi:hypothetical protein